MATGYYLSIPSSRIRKQLIELHDDGEAVLSIPSSRILIITLYLVLPLQS